MVRRRPQRASRLRMSSRCSMSRNATVGGGTGPAVAGRSTPSRSPPSSAALARLREDYAALHARAAVGSDDGFDRLEQSADRDRPEEDARELRRRVRHELGRLFAAIGFLGRDMTRSVWPDQFDATASSRGRGDTRRRLGRRPLRRAVAAVRLDAHELPFVDAGAVVSTSLPS